MSEAFVIVAKCFTFLADLFFQEFHLKNRLQSDLLLLDNTDASLLPIVVTMHAKFYIWIEFTCFIITDTQSLHLKLYKWISLE